MNLPQNPARDLECYLCGEPVTPAEQLETIDALEEDDPDEDNSITNKLNLVNCQGPPEQFDDDGNVVVCPNCIDGAKTDAENSDD